MSRESGRSSHKDQGPQGTQVFSRDEVNQLLQETSDEPSSGSRAELTGVSSAVSGQSFALSTTRLIVGRADNCDLRLEDSSVSSEHARLVKDSAGWRVVNLLSTNGTFVNDRKISSSGISNGDRIRFGRVEFRLYDPDEAASTESGKSSWLPWVAVAVAVAAVAAAVVWVIQ
ncbi:MULTISPECIES: FHA domain-containing protein [unclassified Wenzhouxiangella]|uniref:FHA domain-containing protein n=1 Tax=unclassified Wenzhouxiangella TaxID=2613841 RepID=UPI000E32529B|nr:MULTISPECIES: FHA domain-containing protein [unclassified Wenzhouxiangella]RFF28485.1 FHA domain-containing protein [Wenzhouxiangella sp. 15181]RFP70003.1 FHA domain-containing protein [Wenzhouxiangella sp. 15190]